MVIAMRALLLAALLPTLAAAQTVLPYENVTPEPQRGAVPADLELVPVVSGLTQPVAIRNAKDGTGRLFIVEKSGTIKVLVGNAVLPTPFLVVPVATQSEQGLLGLAFHPNFKNNRKLYIAYTRASGGPLLGFTPDQLVAEYQVSVGNPNVVDPNTRREIITIPDLASNHNGGDLHFGPDGYLYYAMGDGGPQGDPNDLAQNKWRKLVTSPSNVTREFYLAGKILRIDIDQTTPNASAEMCGTATGQTAQYAIPTDSPHAASSQTCDEIYHYGLRNPWRFSFDKRSGEMLIGDVGQGTWEEVSYAPARTPRNFGWRCFEGNHANATTGLCNPLPTDIVPAVLEYQHSDAGGGFRCSISGGYRYRGPILALQGSYIYSDYCSGEVWISNTVGGTWSTAVWRDYGDNVVGFGEDENGALFLVDLDGQILRFNSASDNDFIFGHGSEG